MKYGKISAFVDLESFNNSNGISTTFFYYGCNFHCGFCHNHKMLTEENILLTERDLELILKKAKRNWVSTIVVSGGEPTLDPKLFSFLKHVKSKNFKVKLDTNGSNPDVLKRLVEEDLIDYVAMDIKGTKSQYEILAKYSKINQIQKSIDLIMDKIKDYEFRTTIIPRYHKEDQLLEIGNWLCGAKRYVLQQFQPDLDGGCLDKNFEKMKTYKEEDLIKFKEKLTPYFEEVIIKCK